MQDREAAYNSAQEAWTADSRNPRWMTPNDDEDTRKRMYARFDEVCEIEPTTLHDHYTRRFACSMAIQLMYYAELGTMSTKAKGRIVNAAAAAVCDFARTPNADFTKEIMRPPSDDLSNTGNEPREVGPHLLGEKIRYRDAKTDQVKECTVFDYGKSRVRGLYFDIRDADEVEVRITPEEMKHILENRMG
ncbi:hypothetical protein WOLCODRAFT_135004 [Wolfiporia cocos MD-104 SS10]|uniref:Uncharacterized protein n=1 Tax=Wolfiporia cocos (strain MD-104) TaxID=742152 RepID=A0A2H3J994_WOLCO|nr:hypothetical protein WOLCODRAFT_135004 [Wolfiporia cocos MD-104 SS10]